MCSLGVSVKKHCWDSKAVQSNHVPALAPQILPLLVVARHLIVSYGWLASWKVLAHVEGTCCNPCHSQGCHGSQEHLQHARRLSDLMDTRRPLSDMPAMFVK